MYDDLYDGRTDLDWSGIEGSTIEHHLAFLYAQWHKHGEGAQVLFDVMNSNDMDGVFYVVLSARQDKVIAKGHYQPDAGDDLADLLPDGHDPLPWSDDEDDYED